MRRIISQLPKHFASLTALLLPLAAYSYALVPQAHAADEIITIFAAASLTDAVEEAAENFERETNIQVRLSFASSSTLARQIEAGADADLFLSANEAWADYLLDRNLLDTKRQTRNLTNALVLVGPRADETMPVTALTLEAMTAFLGSDGHLAMGDPDHVPAGIYGKQALSDLDLWKPVRKRVARTDNVRAALALVSRREVPLAIVYKSDLVGTTDLQILFTFETANRPIRYVIAQTTHGQSAASQQFFDYISGPKGHLLFQRYGFTIEKK